MSGTALNAYRRQHGEIETAIGTLSDLLDQPDAVSRTFDIRVVLNDLSAKVNNHLTVEERVLYPRLLEHEDARIRTAVAALKGEMGGLHNECDRYFTVWSNVPAIAARFQTFRSDTRRVLLRLKQCIRHEDEVLSGIH